MFSHNFNPERLRLGNKILRQRLRGPTLTAWYPKKTVSFRDLQDTYRPLGLTTFDEAEDDREEAIQMYEPSTIRAVCKPASFDFFDILADAYKCKIPRKGETQEEANC